MKRKILFLFILIGLVIAVALLVRLLTNRGPKQGELRVDSSPNASIFLNNKNIGRTPFPSQKMDEGKYTIKLVAEGTTTQFVPWEGQIVVGKGLLTYINADLAQSELSSAVDVLWLEKISSKNAELSLTTTPDGATVLVDDVTRGVTPVTLVDIPPGEHTITVTSVGFLTRSLKVKMTPGYRLIVTMKLGLSPGGSIVQTATPTATLTTTPTMTPKVSTQSASISDPAKPFLTIKDTPTGFLRVRQEPNTAATESARVKPGEKFHIESTQNGWYEIKFDGISLGWVSGSYVDKTE